MRRALDLVHRWTGAFLGVVLALMGLSGTLLLWKPWWIMLPGAQDGRIPTVDETLAMVRAAQRLDARHLVLPSEDFGLAQVRLSGEAGAYLAPDGTVIAAWMSRWERPELWLFDLHHELLAGDTGHWVVGLLGIAGIAFVLTGLFLWWPLRRNFTLRAVPPRLTRPAIVRHHRDLGAAMAPLLLLLFLTGAMLAIRPLGAWLLAPLSPRDEVEAWLQTPPPSNHGPNLSAPDWPEVLAQSRQAFPDAELRIVVWPYEKAEYLVVRMRQPAEWHANGRTTLWFAPGRASPVQTRDALAAPAAVAVSNLLWPVHAGKVGGVIWKLLLTAAGLALTLLGTLALGSFWSTGRSRHSPALAASRR